MEHVNRLLLPLALFLILLIMGFAVANNLIIYTKEFANVNHYRILNIIINIIIYAIDVLLGVFVTFKAAIIVSQL
jgi:hypothetical protein